MNTTHPTVNIIHIDDLTVNQRHLECLTNPYLDDKSKYLGDEVIDAWIQHHKLSNTEDKRLDGSVFIERVINTMALENDGRKNAPVHLRMGGSRKGLDYITNQLIALVLGVGQYQHTVYPDIRLNLHRRHY